MSINQLSYIFLTLCIPLLAYITFFLTQRKIISNLLVFVISISFFLLPGLFSFLGFLFLVLSNLCKEKITKIDHLLFSFIFFAIGSIEFVKNYEFKELITIFLLCSIFNLSIFGFLKKLNVKSI
tara:strand:- start:343 stop:714 length:372 start_codon:yes stop_codon:yes gene_type:complete